MKIGIFGGAFNPVHNGHIVLIDSFLWAPMQPEFKAIDKLLIIPTANPPHRSGADLASEQDRINMLNLALENKKNTEISDIEFKLKGKSYTYNTLKALKKLYPSSEFYLFMGSDQLLYFKNWYKYKKILKMARVVGFSRCKEDNEKIRQFLIDNEDLRINAMVAKPFEVSSSEIREKIKNGESIKGLVDEKVEEYIREKGLYV